MHSFSNTGWLAYCGLLGDLASARPAALGAVKGAVIDSAPYPAMSPDVWAAGFLTAAAGGAAAKKEKRAQRRQKKNKGGRANKANGNAAAAAVDGPSCSTSTPATTITVAAAPDRSSLAFRATAAFFGVWMQGGRKRALKATIAHEAAHVAWPALYIFCEDDHVIPAASVRAAAAAHAARAGGAWPARTLCFAASEHVAHLRHHRAAYVAALDAFVAGDVLGKGGEKAVAAVALAPPPTRAAATPPLVPTTALSRSLSRSLSFKLDPAATAALARSASIKAGGPAATAGGGGGLGGLAPLMVGGRGGLARAGSIAAAGAASPTAAMVASLRASLPQLM